MQLLPTDTMKQEGIVGRTLFARVSVREAVSDKALEGNFLSSMNDGWPQTSGKAHNLARRIMFMYVHNVHRCIHAYCKSS